MEELENIESGVMSVVSKVLDPNTLSFFSSLGVWGWVAIGVLLLLVGVGSWLLIKWARDKQKAKAAKKTEENRIANETKLPGEQARLERGARASMKKLREWLKQKNQ